MLLWFRFFLLHGKSTFSVMYETCSVLSDFCSPTDYTVHEVLQARILEWVAFSLLQRTFPMQESNQGLLHCRQILYQLSYQGNPDRDKDLTWMCGGFITSCKFLDTSPTEKQGLYLLPLNLGDFEQWSPAEVMLWDSQSWS